MDSSVVIQLIILAILILLSALFSSAETSLTTSNKLKIQSLADQGSKRARILLKISEDSGKMLSAILIGNNLVNNAATALEFTPAEVAAQRQAWISEWQRAVSR